MASDRKITERFENLRISPLVSRDSHRVKQTLFDSLPVRGSSIRMHVFHQTKAKLAAATAVTTILFGIAALHLLSARATAAPQESSVITIKAVGDIMPGTNFPHNLTPPNDGRDVFARVGSELAGADLLLGNFESTLTTHPTTGKNTKSKLVFAFRTPPAFAHVLRQTGFHVLSVANNHSYDFQRQGYTDTIRNIRAAGITAVGEKGNVATLEIGRTPVRILGFSYLSLHNSMRDPSGIELIRRLQGPGPIVVSVHSGAEGEAAMHVHNRDEIFYGENRGNLVSFAHKAIDAGADLVLGHGPHVPRALELYRGRLIAYSLGNFVGYRMFNVSGKKGISFVLEARLNHRGEFLDGRLHPIRLRAPGLPEPDPSAAAVALVRKLTRADFPRTPLMFTRDGRFRPRSIRK